MTFKNNLNCDLQWFLRTILTLFMMIFKNNPNFNLFSLIFKNNPNFKKLFTRIFCNNPNFKKLFTMI